MSCAYKVGFWLPHGAEAPKAQQKLTAIPVSHRRRGPTQINACVIVYVCANVNAKVEANVKRNGPVTQTGPRLIRAVEAPLGLYFRPGYRDHASLGQLFSGGSPRCSGVVFDPRYADRQADLRQEAAQQKYECILDTYALELSTPGGYAMVAEKVPWSGDSPHTPEDLSGERGGEIAREMAGFATQKGFTAVLAPVHYWSQQGQDWRSVDEGLVVTLREALDSLGATEVPIYYPLAIAGGDLRREQVQQDLKSYLASLPIDAIWLRVHPFGTRQSGPLSLHRYIRACWELRKLALPIVGEKTGTVGIALAAFGALGGVESGITMGEQFDFGRLARVPRDGRRFIPPSRIYLSKLGAFLTPAQAEKFFVGTQMRSRFGCTEACCSRGVRDTIADPRKHFLHSRMREVARLSQVPPSLRASVYMEEFLRPASDFAIAASRKEPKLEPHRKRLDGWRDTLGGLLSEPESKVEVVHPLGARIRHRRGA